MVLDMRVRERRVPVSGADPLEEFGSGLPAGWLTFLFTDIEGSTRLVQEIGTDQYGDLQFSDQLVRDDLKPVLLGDFPDGLVDRSGPPVGSRP